MSADLTSHVEAAGKAARDPALIRAAADAMADELGRITERYLGSDLRMSGSSAGAAEFTGTARGESATVSTSGVYGLADGGRKKIVRAYARRGGALATPWGPRGTVAGSLWPGFGITEQGAPEVFEAGSRAVVDGIQWGE